MNVINATNETIEIPGMGWCSPPLAILRYEGFDGTRGAHQPNREQVGKQAPVQWIALFLSRRMAAEVGDPIEIDDAFRQEQDALADGIDGRVEEEREIELDGHPGIEFVVVSANDVEFVMRVRIYSVGERFYTVWTAGTKRRVQSDLAAAYLESFRLLE